MVIVYTSVSVPYFTKRSWLNYWSLFLGSCLLVSLHLCKEVWIKLKTEITQNSTTKTFSHNRVGSLDVNSCFIMCADFK